MNEIVGNNFWNIHNKKKKNKNLLFLHCKFKSILREHPNGFNVWPLNDTGVLLMQAKLYSYISNHLGMVSSKTNINY